MKILALTKSGDGVGFLDRFIREGHEVRLFVDDPQVKQIGDGRVEKVSSLAEGVLWKPSYLFADMVGNGEICDGIRKKGIPVFGAAKFLDDIELKRELGIDLCKKFGIKTPETLSLNNFDEAMKAVKANPKFLVVKVDGNISAASSFVAKDQKEMIEYLDYMKETQDLTGTKFVLQEKVKGVEISSEIWFSKGRPLLPYNFTFELKRLMAGDLGPNTGCMFSAVAPYLSANPIMIEKTLKKLFPLIEKEGISSCLDINCIINEKTREPEMLEFTARLGFSASYALASTIDGNLGQFFYEVASGKATHVPMSHTWGVALRVATSPYPIEPSDEKVSHAIYDEIKGQPVKVPKDKDLYLCEEVVKDKKGRLVTGGVDGLICECCGSGKTLFEAWNKSKKLFEQVEVPNKMARVADAIDRAYKDSLRMRQMGYKDVPNPSPNNSLPATEAPLTLAGGK